MAFRYIGTSTTTITNEGTENPTINGIVVTTKTEGDIVFYQTGRYVWLDDMWNYQGDLHTHADVQSALNEIAEAYKGEEVRGSIYDAIALIDTRSAAMEDTIGANITSMVEPIVDRKISTFILDYETSVGNVAQCNLTYEQLRTKLTSNLKAIVHVNGYECDCHIDVQSTYIDVYATSDPMKNNEDTRGTIYYKFNHSNDSVTVNYEQSAKKYQEKLTAGPNIIIDGNEISAVGGANTIGIEFMIDTNTALRHDEITINKTWSEVELYMDAVYESGYWDDYDLWHEIQKDCVLKDLRDYPDYSIYPLVGVKFNSFNSNGDPLLLFSSRALDDDTYPENNIHYISFKWPNHSWSDSQIESNIDEFDILSDPKLITRNWTDTGDSDITPYPYYVRYNTDADFKSAYGISVNDLLNAVNTGKYYNLALTILTDTGGMIELTEYSKCNVLYIDYSRYSDGDELDFKVYFMADFHHTYLVDDVEHTDYYVMMPHVLNVSVSYSGSTISYIDAGVKRTHYLNKKDAGLGIKIENGLVKVKLRSSNPGLAFDNDGGLYATGGGGGGTTYTAGAGIDIDSNNVINTVRIKISHLDVTDTPTINYTWTEINNLLGPYTAYGSATCYLWYSHGNLMYDSAIGYYTITSSGITIRFTCIYDNTIEYRKYYLSSANVLTMEERIVTDYQKKLASANAGTGISITNDAQGNPVISLDLPQAEGGGF